MLKQIVYSNKTLIIKHIGTSFIIDWDIKISKIKNMENRVMLLFVLFQYSRQCCKGNCKPHSIFLHKYHDTKKALNLLLWYGSRTGTSAVNKELPVSVVSSRRWSYFCLSYPQSVSTIVRTLRWDYRTWLTNLLTCSSILHL